MSRFRLNCLARVLALTASIFLFLTLLDKENYRVTMITVALLIIYQIVRLINVVESTNKHVAQFLDSISQSDFSQNPTPRNLGPTFDELKDAYQKVLKIFRDSRAETEEKARYLQMILQHVRIGLIGFNQEGKIDLYNHTAKKYLQCNQLRDVSDIESINEELAVIIQDSEVKPNTIVKMESGGEYLQLVINVSRLQFRNHNQTLISMYDIQSELEEKEMEAWQNLIRVLTHEIMNSITPISSLAGTANLILKDNFNPDQECSNELKKVTSAVDTIQKRSESLMNFVENYRKLTRIPTPNFKQITVDELFNRIEGLLKHQIQEANVQFEIKIEPPKLKLICDPSLIEQVLINLLVNAIHATKQSGSGKIMLEASQTSIGKIQIDVTDNGNGIEQDVIDKVFIPFFTTKPKGSGIGLSFSKQVMRAHGGSIKVVSEPQKETRFTLKFT